MSFLKAEWRKLALANYVVDKSLPLKYLPYGTEIDLWQNRCYLSLVGFMFVNTRLLGMKIPFHVHFEEVNLRFYVRRKDGKDWKRGVVFIKEIVPKPALTFVANTVYNENYETMPMSHSWSENDKEQQIVYRWKKKSQWQKLLVTANKAATAIREGSETEFITEHYRGYAKLKGEKSNEYEVTHPRWMCYAVRDHRIEVNFGLTYGKEFNFLNDVEPASVMLAEGSEITVERKTVINV